MGRLHGLDLLFHGLYRSGLFIALYTDCVGFGFFSQLFTGGGKPAAGNLRHIERPAYKCPNIRLPLYQQRQGGRHHTAHIQRDPVQDREKPGSVNPNQPVSPGPADRHIIECIVITSGAQVFKAVPDRSILHTGNPEAFHWFLTSSVFVDQTEDQLTLTPGVCCAHHGIHPFVLHQPAQKGKLFLFILWDLIFPCFRQDRQVSVTPSGILFPVSLRLCQFQKVPYAPAHQIAAALQIAVFFLIRT